MSASMFSKLELVMTRAEFMIRIGKSSLWFDSLANVSEIRFPGCGQEEKRGREEGTRRGEREERQIERLAL